MKPDSYGDQLKRQPQ